MISKSSYQGLLLAAHPRRRDAGFRRGVILVSQHSDHGALGLQINKQIVDGLDLRTVMANSDLITDLNGPVYWGGPDRNNRITVLHSLDWTGLTTEKITQYLGYTTDTSVLAALGTSRAPKYYRVILGHTRWPPGDLDAEIESTADSAEDSWICCDANPNLVFASTGAAQWRQVIETAALLQINQWFS